jgi:hypothetical protein
MRKEARLFLLIIEEAGTLPRGPVALLDGEPLRGAPPEVRKKT